MASVSGFLRDERGAVTTDWVALTAGIMVLAIAAVYATFSGDGVGDTLTNIEDSLTGISQDAMLASVTIAGGGTINPK